MRSVDVWRTLTRITLSIIVPGTLAGPGQACNQRGSFFIREQGDGGRLQSRRLKSGSPCVPRSIWRIAQRKLDQIAAVTRLNHLSVPPGNHLEALVGDRKGQHSIRINDQYRVCFRWTDAGCENVEITDYH